MSEHRNLPMDSGKCRIVSSLRAPSSVAPLLGEVLAAALGAFIGVLVKIIFDTLPHHLLKGSEQTTGVRKRGVDPFRDKLGITKQCIYETHRLACYNNI